MKERLQKIISAAGLASRRSAETLIRAGRVTVNGVPAALGDSADAESDDIRVDGKRLSVSGERIYIMLNKPRGYVTTLRDDRGRKCVSELVSAVGVRLYPVGRLDLNSEGLLIMTNDGAAANALAHPSHGVVKTYEVTVSGADAETAAQRLSAELELDGRLVRASFVKILRSGEEKTLLSVGITQGLNRQIRRMCEKAGLSVHRLRRVAEGELRLGTLRSGAWRHLTQAEKEYILNLTEKRL